MVSFKEKPPYSFCKFFSGDIPSKLRIPPGFVGRYGELVPKIYGLLETESGKYSWEVKIKQIGQYLYLADGWPDFAKDNHITLHDFLLFRLVGESTFQVSIYGIHGCPSDPSSSVSPNSQRSGKGVEEEPETEPKEGNNESGGEIRRQCWFEYDAASENLIKKGESMVGPTKRGRGRPPKNLMKKRGRGRPPKNLVDDLKHKSGRKRRPSFFKVLIEDYSARLGLPHAFVQEYGEFLHETAKLRTSSGEIWDVKLDEQTYDDDDDEKYLCFIGGGWRKFVKDLGLDLGEFLVFWFNVGDSTFEVSVFATSCCEREIPGMDVDSDADEDDESNSDCRSVPGARKELLRSCANESEAAGTLPRFERELKGSRKFRLCVPKIFAEAVGLIGQRAVVLEYPPKQRYWSVILDQRKDRGFSLELTSGWNIFIRENGLEVGKTYSFEFNPSKNVIQVKEQKK